MNLAPLVKDAAPLGPQEATHKAAHIVDLGPGDLVRACCRANMAHIGQLWPNSGLGFQVEVLKPF